MTTLTLATLLIDSTFASESIPFEMVSNLIIVSTTVDDKTGDFIIDTGVPIVFLNHHHFEGKELQKMMHGINGEGGGVKTKYSKITLGSQTWKSVYCEITNLDALERALHRPILGLIGCQLFNKHIVEIDYKNKRLHLELSANHKDADPANTFKCKGKIPVISVNIGSKKLKLIIDTGSAYNILRKSDLGALEANTIQGDQQRLVGLGQGELKVGAGTIFDLEVQGKVCAPMKTLFSDDQHIQMLCPGQSVDGILGSEYLKQVKIVLDFKRKTVTFFDQDDLEERDLAKK